MAYLPPHKRNADSASSFKPAPTPFKFTPKFKQPQSPTKSKRNNFRTNVIYGIHSISRWWPAGSSLEDPIPDSLYLRPFDCEVLERRNGMKPMVIVGEVGVEDAKPWVRIAERLLPDLVETAKGAMSELESERVKVKLSFVARIGKVLFFGDSAYMDKLKNAADPASVSRYHQLHKSFFANVPSAYVDDIHSAFAKLGFEFDSEKEHYMVKVLDKRNLESNISCKCVIVKDTGILEIHKVELDSLRQFGADISCLTKDFDLRFILNKRRTLKRMNEEERKGLNKLVSSAIIDPNVKEGLRWPIGQESGYTRFKIVEVWHTKYKVFKSRTMRLKLRCAERFDHMMSDVEVSSEVTIKQTEISKHLSEGNFEDDSLHKNIEEAVEQIWNNFLTCNHNSD